MEDFRFQVNLGGMIEILSDHLYSSPAVYIRELLQNGVDAITARHIWTQEEDAHREESASGEKENGTEQGNPVSREEEGRITLDIDEGRQLIFSDNGLGLTEAEVHQFLAIIGESSKHGLANEKLRTDYIGRFGVGLLSCFMVSDEIRLVTRSCKREDAPLLEWCGKPDGTYTLTDRTGDDDFLATQDNRLEHACGTKIILTAKSGQEHYFQWETVENLVLYYGMILPFPVLLRQNGQEKQINTIYLPWEGYDASKQELLLFGQMVFGEKFFDCVPFHSKKGNLSGVAYILNYAVLPSAKPRHRIFLKNMLLTEKGDNLIPDWAVFTRCIINARDLRPTASREDFYIDEVLEDARGEIEDALINYISDLASSQQQMFGEFFRIHHLTLMSLALAAPKLFGTLIDYIEFSTTRGMMTGYDLRMCGEELVYAPTREKYKQLSQLFFAQDKLLIDVSYVHAYDLLMRLGQMYGLEVNAVKECVTTDLMHDLAPEEQDIVFEFMHRANRILKQYDCRAEVKIFLPNSQPTFYLVDENTLLKRQIQSSRAQADAMFFQMLDAFAEDFSDKTAATLYFNYNNPMVKRLVKIEEDKLLRICVEILYVQALQIGGFTLHNNELGMLNRNILSLMEAGLEN